LSQLIADFHKRRSKKGETIMGIFETFFGEKKPADAAGKDEVPRAGENPFTAKGVQKAGAFFFKCPTCTNTLRASIHQINPINGINVACQGCKNISHVPGAFKNKTNPSGIRITGGVRVPVSQFSEWYFRHPFIEGLIKSGRSDLLYNYGLWVFCSTCYHQFPATMLGSFVIAARAGGLIFNARTPDSAKDMEALRAGHCSQCQNTNLIVIAAEIPDYVRDAIIRTNQ
jgi:hypothetical protein